MPKTLKINVTVSVEAGSPPSFSYKSPSSYVDDDGNITVPFNSKAKIKWLRDKKQKSDWAFLKGKAITFKYSGPYDKIDEEKDEVYWSDDNVTGIQDFENYYYLHTDLGSSPDPMLTNQGSGGFGVRRRRSKSGTGRKKARKKATRKKAARSSRRRR